MPMEKIELMLQMFTLPLIDDSYLVNWKSFIVSNLLNTYSFLTNVNTLPSLDTLMDLNQSFQAQIQQQQYNNHCNKNILLKDDFDKIEFWFHRDTVTSDTSFKQLLYSLVYNDIRIYICQTKSKIVSN